MIGSPTGEGGEQCEEHCGEPTVQGDRCTAYDGKVSGLIYNCFGGSDGFLLVNCEIQLTFRARKHQIEELVRIDWRERIALAVVTEIAHPNRPLSIILRRAPKNFPILKTLK